MRRLIDDVQVSCSNCSLDAICLPRGLSPEDIQSLGKAVKRKKTLQRGEFIYREGAAFKGILAIKAGTAKLVKDDMQGNEHIIDMLLPGELLGFDGLYDNYHSCSAIALETLSFCELPSDHLESLCQQVPALMRELFRHTGEKLNEDRLQRVLHKRPAEVRLVYFLVNLSERFKRRGFSASEFRLPLTRQELGNYLGLAFETVSRLLTQLHNAGLISVSNRQVRIINLDGLRALQQHKD